MSYHLFSKTTLLACLLCLTTLLPSAAYAADDDGDGIDDSIDNCPTVKNPDQKNWDGDVWDTNNPDTGGDLCDEDDDNDGHKDTADLFPHNADEWADNDKDGIGDNADPDDDNDGVFDAVPDNCPLIANPNQLNTDANSPNGDSDGDACDSDEDGDDDLHLGIKDAFPLDNTEWSDRDGDGKGDNADLDNNNNGINDDVDEDDDSDGIKDVVDNCSWTNSLDQTNTDGDIWDGIHLNQGDDVCDTDDDNDGHLDTEDVFPLDASEWQDTDGDGVGDNSDWAPNDPTERADNDSDGVGDNRDPDDDNDNIPDLVEISYSLNPKIADSGGNADGDTFSNLVEYLAGSSPKDTADTPTSRIPRQYKMVTDLGTAGDSLGSAVAIIGGTAVVGAPNGYIIKDIDKKIAIDRGGAYIFTSPDSGSSWQQSAKIIPTSSTHARLGKAVALANSGSDLLLSADGTNNTGVVYVYAFSGGEWTLTQTLSAADSGTNSNNNQAFGSGIVISGSTALISAPGTNTSGNFAGAAYIYVRNNTTDQWEYKATLKGNDTSTQHFFGSSIALENGRAVIGASGVSNKGANSGKVYLFEGSGTSWGQITSLQGDDTGAGHYFGASVALSRDTVNTPDTLVVGASGVKGVSGSANTGAAYVFKLSGGLWTQQAKLAAPASDTAAQLFFGYSALMIDNETIMIGTPWANSRGKSSTGGIYIYRLNAGSWDYNGKLQSHDRQSGDYYGYRLAYGLINTTPTLIVGAPGVDDNGDGAGAAYSVNLTGIDTDDDGDKIADAFDNCVLPVVSPFTTTANNDQADLDGDGKGDICDPDRDGDGVDNGLDLFPDDVNESLDTDGDGMGDKIDPDADDDGIPDRIEEATKLYDANNNLLGALNWLVDTDAAGDLDGDGYSNLAEYLAGTDMTDAASNPGKLTAIFQKLITKDGTLNDRFGDSVAIAGDYAIIGAVNGKSNGSSGAAYIFEKNGVGNWSQKAKLVASDATNLAKFGSSVAIFGNIAVVGAPGASHSGYINAGAVYIFQRDGSGNWLQREILTATEPGTSHNFGSSVAINSTARVVVGAPGAHKNSRIANTGAVYIFESDGSNWQQQQKLTAFDSKGNDGFGSSVAVAGDLVMAGSPLADSVDYATGAVYLFRRDGSGGWSEKKKLVASNGLNGDQFGSSIAFSSLTQTVAAKLTYFGTLAVGAPGRDDSGASSGAAYAFSYQSTSGYNDDSAWTQETSLFKARDGARSDSLGASVALTFSVDGDGKRNATVVAGAKLRDSKNIDSGAVYLFTQSAGNGWVQQTPLAASDSKSYDYFGSSVAIDSNSNRRLLIGANGNDDNDIEAGVAFIVDYSKTDSDADGIYNTFDNCVDIANPDQLNTDQNFSNGDSFGDACDDNDDGDVDKITDLPVNDVDDAFPLDPNEQYDTDGDGIGNNADEDDDNDGIPDAIEDSLLDAQGNKVLNSKDASDAAKDYDGDGLSNLREYQINMNPLSKNIIEPDSDGDDYSDSIEDYYGTSPNDDKSTPALTIALTPLKPVIKPIASPLPLTVRSFDTGPFKDAGDNDPESGKKDYLTESEWEINSFITFADNGRSRRRNLRGVTSAAEEEKVRKLTIADAILLPGGHYWIRTRHRDDTYWSEWSEPVEISVSTEGSHDSNLNGVDDRYDAGRGFDANGDGAIDPASAEPNIVSLRNTGDSSIIGVQLSGTATFGQLSAIAYSTLPTSLTADGKMPYGLFNFRIEGLVASDASPAQVTVSFYLPTVPPAEAKWYKYNPSTNTLTDMTTRVEILDKKVSLTLLDGGEDDADGVVNGVVVDPSGLYITLTDEEKLSGYKAGALSPLLLLGLLLCWPLRRLGRKQAV